MQVRSLELRERLLERLDRVKQERLATEDVIRSLENKIKAATVNAPDRPQYPPKRLEQEIKNLEYEHTTNTMSKKQEKNHLKKIDSLKAQRRLYRGWEISQRNIVRLKQQLSMGKEQVDKLRKTERELGKGLRKVEVTRKIFSLCGVMIAPAEVVEEAVPYKASFLQDIVGRNGSNVSKLEVNYKVVIDIDRGRRCVLILGRADHVTNAKEAIESISDGIDEKVEVDLSTKKLLLARDRLRCRELEEKYMVRIRLSNNPNYTSPVNIRGKADKVALVKEAFTVMLAAGQKGQIAKGFVGAIIGKGGAQIRQLEAEFKCDVHVGQSSSDKVTISVFGEKDAMASCWDKINEIVTSNTTHKESVDMDKEMISQFIGPKGANINGIRRRTRVNIQIDKSTDKVTISGKTAELDACRREIDEFKATWFKTNWIKVVPVVTGSVLPREKVDELKKETGANIQYIRGNTRGLRGEAARRAAQNATKAKIIISGTEEAVAAARKAVEGLICGLVIETIKVASSEIGSIIGPKGSVISQIQKKTKAKINLEEPDSGPVCEISGEKSAVAEAMDLVNEILEKHRREHLEFAVHPLVVKALKTERGGRSAGVIGSKTGVRVILPREQNVGSLILRGGEDAIRAAQDMLEEVYGKQIFNTSSPDMHVVECPVAEGYMGAVIGKGASTIRELQNENGVVVLVTDSSRSRRSTPDNRRNPKDPPRKLTSGEEESKSYVSIIGPPEAAQTAKMAILRRLSRTVKIKVDISANTNRLQKVFGKNLVGAMRRLEGQCGGSRNVKIVIKEMPRDCEISVSGYCFAAEKVKGIIEAAKRGHIMVEVQALSPEHIEYVKDTHGALISQIKRRNEVILKLDTESAKFRITGSVTNAHKAEDSIHKCLQFSYSNCYSRIPIHEAFAASLRQDRFAKVKALETETDTKIDLTNTHIFIRGEDATTATERVNKLLGAHKHEHAEVQITQDLIGRIIGAKGDTIRRLTRESGAKIDIDKVNMKVQIRGKQEQVQAAKALVEDIVKTEAARRLQFVVPEDACPAIIGKGGETIRRIEGDTNTRLNVERNSSRVTITGDPEGVIAAKALVDELLEKMAQEHEERRSKMIMERTREEEDNRERGRDGGGSGGRGRARNSRAPNNRGKPSAPPGFDPENEEDEEPKISEPKKISGMGPTRAQLKNMKRSQKRAKQRHEDETLELVTSNPSSFGGFSADDLLSSLGLNTELPPAPATSTGETYYKSAGYSLRLDK